MDVEEAELSVRSVVRGNLFGKKDKKKEEVRQSIDGAGARR